MRFMRLLVLRSEALLRRVAIAPALFCVCFLPFGCGKNGDAGPVGPAPAVSEQAPDFTLRDLQGNEAHLSDIVKEKPALLVFFATWCSACVDEVPELNALQKELGDPSTSAQGRPEHGRTGDKAAILAIDPEESKGEVARFAAKHKISYRILLDTDGAVFRRYAIEGVPTLFIVDRDGRIYHVTHVARDAKRKLIELLATAKAQRAQRTAIPMR